MPRYLEHFPKPLLEDLVQNRWVPIIGAGMSLNAVVRGGRRLPLWKDLAKSLADDLTGYTSEDALDVISAYEHRFSRVRLIEKLTALLSIERSDPGVAHKAFCSIPFDTLVTTNFDFLLERQYQTLGKYCRPVTDEDQLSIGRDHSLTDDRQERRAVTLLKIHGDLHHPQRMVITERDYERFLNDYPLIATFLGNLLISRTAVLIGYSLDDPDFRQLWNLISSRLGSLRRPAYTIAVDASDSYIAKFQRRNVHTINLPGSRSKVGQILADTFEEIAQYFTSNSIAASQPVEEQPLQQFTLPPDALSRLCFFSVPLKLNPFYRETVYPIAQESGFVPVSPYEVIAPGDAILPKIQAIIDRAELVLIDVAGQSSDFEIRYALQRLGTKRVLIVVDRDQTAMDLDLVEVRTVRRPTNPTVDDQEFVRRIQDWFRAAARELAPRFAAEPARLLEKGEFRAAVVAALTSLEATLRERLPISPDPKNRPIALSQLLELGRERNLLTVEDTVQLRNWLKTRNAVVHGRHDVSSQNARMIVQGVAGLIGRLTAA